MAVNFCSSEGFWISTAGPATDHFSGGANVSKVANGFIVTPKSIAPDSETYVFADAAQMSAFLRKRYTPKPAKKKKAGG